MPQTSHTKAADAHEAAVKMHRSAADEHAKGDHKAGLEHAEKAVKLSKEAQERGTGAHAKSKSAAH
ncbi:hypothetical protein [Telmatospirillum siberiense]|uniref:Uncharacterized protein n=1 Tax=Telmatospirillum siberiense TaxID=382514 RepID=A0A2N3PRL3_9PROT|nr:hypothetical protein [Telmatospirillum siberiense]PKU23043.1 hypothetical protein CWS72_18585 [Telmatospirillum siberiense]